MSNQDDPLAECCRHLAASQHIIEEKDAEIELLRGYRDEAESEAAIASLAVQRLRLTDAEREAIQTAAREADAHQHAERSAILRGLLERLG